MDPASQTRYLAARIDELRRIDRVDSYRFRLLALRTRIQLDWPAAGGRRFHRQKGLAGVSEGTISDLLVALPAPLPLAPGEPPVPLMIDGETDLKAVAGRAVDAALALLVGNSLDAPYPGEVRMLESLHPDALEPISVSQPSVGLLVATIIGTLEAIHEQLVAPSTSQPAKDSAGLVAEPAPPSRKGPPLVRP